MAPQHAAVGWIATLRRIGNTAVDAPAAEPLALLMGAGLGGAIGGAFNGLANIGWPALIGAGLGQISLLHSRLVHEQQNQHRQHWQFLRSYQGTLEALDELKIRFENVVEVSRMYQALMRGLETLVEDFREHRELHHYPCSAQEEEAIKEFFLNHCGSRDAMLLRRENDPCCFLAAVESKRWDRLVRQIVVEEKPPMKALRQERTAFIRLDLLDTSAGSLDVHEASAAPPLSSRRNSAVCPSSSGARGAPTLRLPRRPVEKKASAQLRQRRTQLTSTGSTSPAKFNVVRDPKLIKQCLDLDPRSPTLRSIEKIESDLAGGRHRGHQVTFQGLDCFAEDINVMGLAGRNLWRLLYQRDNTGFKLLGIADYHEKQRPWWPGRGGWLAERTASNTSAQSE